MSDILLHMDNIKKDFSGVQALSGVNLQVARGEIHALMGENGSGKSTLMNILGGVYPYGTYEGEIVYEGRQCHFKSIKDSEKRGIAIIHQELSLIPGLSAGENIFLGNEKRGRFGAIDWDSTYRDAQDILKSIGANIDVMTPVRDLSAGNVQMVEIAKAIGKKARLLILDEPTSSLNDEESKRLLDLLLEFKKSGITSIIISHKLKEITYVADRLTVIRDGRTIATLDNNDHSIDEDLIIKHMVGRELDSLYPPRDATVSEEKVLDVKHLYLHNLGRTYRGRKHSLEDVSFYLRKGEIVGIAGLQGSGRTILCRSLFGCYGRGAVKGEVTFLGERVLFSNPKEAIKNGLCYVTENRFQNGLLLDKPVVDNTTLSALWRVTEGVVINREKELEAASKYAGQMQTRLETIFDRVGSLSGGNQQKVLLAKCFFAEPKVLLLDEPTRGIDVGAKYDIYTLINRYTQEGGSVVMVSSEMAELIGMCDRIYVMNEGRIVGELEAAEATQEKIMRFIV